MLPMDFGSLKEILNLEGFKGSSMKVKLITMFVYIPIILFALGIMVVINIATKYRRIPDLIKKCSNVFKRRQK